MNFSFKYNGCTIIQSHAMNNRKPNRKNTGIVLGFLCNSEKLFNSTFLKFFLKKQIPACIASYAQFRKNNQICIFFTGIVNTFYNKICICLAVSNLNFWTCTAQTKKSIIHSPSVTQKFKNFKDCSKVFFYWTELCCKTSFAWLGYSPRPASLSAFSTTSIWRKCIGILYLDILQRC